MKKIKVLFILKKRVLQVETEDGQEIKKDLETGLYNSVSFVTNALTELGIENKMAVVHDNNSIDREVHQYRPTHVIIEAVWVVPEKFEVLCRLHPTVKWIIRLHSDTPFLAGEGNAYNWVYNSHKHPKVYIAANAPRMREELQTVLCKLCDEMEDKNKPIYYMPNFYDLKGHKPYDVSKHDKGDHIDIGCFGAIRPLKNQLLQAISALRYAHTMDKKLRFHVNASRIEMNGSSTLRNMYAIFENIFDSGHELVCHNWLCRNDFLELCSQMDVGMQVSFSETFNIVAADLISQGIPVVTSNEIPWAVDRYNAIPTDSNDIMSKIYLSIIEAEQNVSENQKSLQDYVQRTKEAWLAFISEEQK